MSDGRVSPAEFAAHKAFYDLTVAQRNHAWAESARYKAELDWWREFQCRLGPGSAEFRGG